MTKLSRRHFLITSSSLLVNALAASCRKRSQEAAAKNDTVPDAAVSSRDYGRETVTKVLTIRVPDKVGEYAKVTSAIAENGWGIYTSGGVPSPKRPGFWDMIIKVRSAPKDKLVTVLEGIEGQEIMDVREYS